MVTNLRNGTERLIPQNRYFAESGVPFRRLVGTIDNRGREWSSLHVDLNWDFRRYEFLVIELAS